MSPPVPGGTPGYLQVAPETEPKIEPEVIPETEELWVIISAALASLFANAAAQQVARTIVVFGGGGSAKHLIPDTQ